MLVGTFVCDGAGMAADRAGSASQNSREAGDRSQDGEASIVDQVVDPPVKFFRALDLLNNAGLRLSHVQLDDLAARILDGLNCLLGPDSVPYGADDMMTRFERAQAKNQTKAIGCAGDEPDWRRHDGMERCDDAGGHCWRSPQLGCVSMSWMSEQ